LEQDYLAKYTPCHFTDLTELAYAIGVVHVELILIHPFREGNGRTARLLADLMAVQANRTPLNYAFIDQIENPNGFKQYIEAIHAGVEMNYEPIRNIFITLME
jgi:cell filamentation protein